MESHDGVLSTSNSSASAVSWNSCVRVGRDDECINDDEKAEQLLLLPLAERTRENARELVFMMIIILCYEKLRLRYATLCFA